jgi:hypothetical protein
MVGMSERLGMLFADRYDHAERHVGSSALSERPRHAGGDAVGGSDPRGFCEEGGVREQLHPPVDSKSAEPEGGGLLNVDQPLGHFRSDSHGWSEDGAERRTSAAGRGVIASPNVRQIC